MITLKRYSKSLRDPHHRDRLEKTLDNIDPNLKITAYDEEIYKLDNMLDEYTDKLNARSLELGRVYVNPKSYTWVTEKIIDGVKKYYFDFFGLNDIQSLEMKPIINNYIAGLIWVFDYYYNIEPKKEPTASIWFYQYNNAPLLTQIYNFIKEQPDNYIDQLSKDISKYEVKTKDFFAEEEHLMYVSPLQSYPEIIPSKYKKVKLINIDINKITNEIFSNKMSDEIDCRGVIFLNKCHVNELHIEDDIMESYEKDKQFIRKLRVK